MKNRSCILFALTTFAFNLILGRNVVAVASFTSTSTNNKQPASSVHHNIITSSSKEEPNVVICGGGPGGLLASVLLNNIGIKSTVVEKSIETDSWGTKSYTIILNDKGKKALKQARCLETAMEIGSERSCTYIFNGTTGEIKTIPKKSPDLALSRPLLVQCIENIASELPNVTLKKGVGVSSVTNDKELGLLVHLEDGTKISATHVIGADGKWSNVRQSFPSFLNTMVTCPSSAVHMTMNYVPKIWKPNGMYIIKPSNDECKFYIIASPLPDNCGVSISMIYYDETLEKYPWLVPPIDTKPTKINGEDWIDDSSSPVVEGIKNIDSTSTKLADHLKQLFEKELPALYAVLDGSVFDSAVVKRRVTWLQMEAELGKEVTYSTEDGSISLIGDAAHAMTPSMGEGGNTALESAVKLVDAVVSTMKEKDETSCTTSTMSLAFMRYGSSRPKDCISLQKLSASRNVLKK